jgi:hypothetical protein
VALGATFARLDYGLLVPASGERPLIARGLRSSMPDIVEIAGAVAPSAMSIAGSGEAAILYSAGARRLQFVVGLPGAPRALDPIDAAVLDMAPSAIAVDTAGATALLAGADGQIYRARRGSPDLVAVARVRGASSLSILPGGNAALVAGPEMGEVLLIDGFDGAPAIRSIAGPLAARAVQALDGRSAAVILNDGRLAIADLDAGSLEWLPLAADAEDFDSLDRSLFVLNRAGAAPLVLLDAAHGRSAWFVPPARPPARPRGHGKNPTRGEDRPN